MSLEPNQDIEFLQWQTALHTKNLKLPHAEAEKLKLILVDNQIKPEEFLNELNKILENTNSLSWKVSLFFNSLQTQLVNQIKGVYFSQICISLFLLLFIYILNKKLQHKKSYKQLYKFGINLVIRISALAGYFMPLMFCYTNYFPVLLLKYPYLRIFVTKFMESTMLLIHAYPKITNYGYFFACVFIFLTWKIPKPRIIRFHITKGLFIYVFQSFLYNIWQLFFEASLTGYLNHDQLISLTMIIFSVNMFWFIPGFFQALTLSYPKNHFMRDAIEIIVGPDKTEGFKWWDR